MIIALSGKIGSGKTLISRLLLTELNGKSKETLYVPRGFADGLKKVIATITGCFVSDLHKQEFKDLPIPDELQSRMTPMTYRDLHLIIGNDLAETISRNIWTYSTLKFDPKDFSVLITDLRLQRELTAIEKKGIPYVTIRINAEKARDDYGNYRERNLPVDSHFSEIELDDAEFDFYINNGPNTTIQELQEQVVNIVKQIKKEVKNATKQ